MGETGAQHTDSSVFEEAVFPLDDLKEASIHLRRPWPAGSIRWKVQAQFPKDNPRGALVVAYIDARLVIDRLNLVMGADGWFAKPHHFTQPDQGGGKFMLCTIVARGRNGDWIEHADVGESSKGFSKDLFSDSLKRAAVHLGVGVSLYALPQLKLWAPREGEPKGGNVKIETRRVWNKQAKAYEDAPMLVIPDVTLRWLERAYGTWLTEVGEPRFGPVLAYEQAMDQDRSAFLGGLEGGLGEDASIEYGEDAWTPAAEGGVVFTGGFGERASAMQPEQQAVPDELLATLRDAHALLGDPDDVIDRKVQAAAAAGLKAAEVLLQSATQRWRADHDDPAPWESALAKAA